MTKSIIFLILKQLFTLSPVPSILSSMLESIEYNLIQKLIRKTKNFSDVTVLDTIEYGSHSYDLPILSFGNQDPQAPTFAICSGIHGLEKIGVHVTYYYLRSLIQKLSWDRSYRDILKDVRVCAFPLVNPMGTAMNRRSNANGVDLMRNAPINGEIDNKWMIAAGHRISPKLPWYRGEDGILEKENQALLKFSKQFLFKSSFCFSLDIHSGFGMRDRLWYPYAKTTDEFPKHKLAERFKKHLKLNFKYHYYKVEKQSDSYLLHGDMWDYIFDEYARQEQQNQTFIPWTLEMGSWIWLKKSPTHFLLKDGLFNPIKPHRYKRILRRHWRLLDFFLHSIYNYKNWIKNEHTPS